MKISAYFFIFIVTMAWGCSSDSTKPAKPSAQDEKDVGDNVDSNTDDEIDSEDNGKNGGEGGGGDKSENCADNPMPFISIWRTYEANERVTLPLVTDAGDYDITVDWGFGNTSRASNDGEQTASHVYENEGEHMVRIEGHIGSAWSFEEASKRQGEGKTYAKGIINLSKRQLLSIIDLGSIGWKSLRGAFHYAKLYESKLKSVAGGCTDEVTDMAGVFYRVLPTSYYLYDKKFEIDQFYIDFSNWNFSSIATGDGLKNLFRYDFNDPDLTSGIYSDFVEECQDRCIEESSEHQVDDCNRQCEEWTTGYLTTESYGTLLKRLADTPENGGLRDDVAGVVMTVPAQYSHEAGVARLELEYNHSFTFYDLGQASP